MSRSRSKTSNRLSSVAGMIEQRAITPIPSASSGSAQAPPLGGAVSEGRLSSIADIGVARPDQKFHPAWNPPVLSVATAEYLW